MTDQTHPVDEMLPPPRLAALGLQHVLVMYAGAIAVPLILAGAAGLPADQRAYLISADILACGLATLVQSFGLPGVGIRLPVMMGVTFASVAPMLALVGAANAAGGAPTAALTVIYGSVIARNPKRFTWLARCSTSEPCGSGRATQPLRCRQNWIM